MKLAAEQKSVVSEVTLSRVVVFPEDFQQVGKADLLGIEDDSDDLGVAGLTCRTGRVQGSNNTRTGGWRPAAGQVTNPAAERRAWRWNDAQRSSEWDQVWTGSCFIFVYLEKVETCRPSLLLSGSTEE